MLVNDSASAKLSTAMAKNTFSRISVHYNVKESFGIDKLIAYNLKCRPIELLVTMDGDDHLPIG